MQTYEQKRAMDAYGTTAASRISGEELSTCSSSAGATCNNINIITDLNT